MNKSHWSPIYIKNRLLEMQYRRRHKDVPWLTPEANEFLDNVLKDTDVVLEYGSGGSSAWFAQRVKKIISVEHNKGWYEKVSEDFKVKKINNIDYVFADVQNGDEAIKRDVYLTTVKQLEDESVDIVLVDGIYRDSCANESIRVLKQGGVLVIDNVERYLPSYSLSPESIGNNKFYSDLWESFYHNVLHWRCYWTSSGVTDTAFYFKP